MSVLSIARGQFGPYRLNFADADIGLSPITRRWAMLPQWPICIAARAPSEWMACTSADSSGMISCAAKAGAERQPAARHRGIRHRRHSDSTRGHRAMIGNKLRRGIVSVRHSFKRRGANRAIAQNNGTDLERFKQMVRHVLLAIGFHQLPHRTDDFSLGARSNPSSSLRSDHLA